VVSKANTEANERRTTRLKPLLPSCISHCSTPSHLYLTFRQHKKPLDRIRGDVQVLLVHGMAYETTTNSSKLPLTLIVVCIVSSSGQWHLCHLKRLVDRIDTVRVWLEPDSRYKRPLTLIVILLLSSTEHWDLWHMNSLGEERTKTNKDRINAIQYEVTHQRGQPCSSDQWSI